MKYAIPDDFQRSSKFSDDRAYRYELSRRWDSRPVVLFVMLNPSVADDEVDDATQLRCRRFAQNWGLGGYYAANLFAYVSTDPGRAFQCG